MRGTGPLSCRDFVASIDEFLSADRTAAELARLDRHLNFCASCEAYTNTYLGTLRVLRRAFAAEVTVDPPEAWVQSLLAQGASERHFGPRP